jgi:hypothetical protein
MFNNVFDKMLLFIELSQKKLTIKIHGSVLNK